MVREKLAEYAHMAWSGWMAYLFEKSVDNPDGTVTIPAWAVTRWRRQVITSYAELPENEKESDRKEADYMLRIFYEAQQSVQPTLLESGQIENTLCTCPICQQRTTTLPQSG